MNKKTRAVIAEELRDLAQAFRKNDNATAKTLRIMAADADADDLDSIRKHCKQLGVHVRAAILDLCPVAYDWIRFGVAWPDSTTRFSEAEVTAAKAFLKKYGGRQQDAYNAALQKLVRGDEDYATIAAWIRGQWRRS